MGQDVERELTEVYQSALGSLQDWLVRSFPRLRNDAEDILQSAYLELIQRVRIQGVSPGTNWETALRQLARQRAIDRLRSVEYRIFRQMTGGTDEDTETGEDMPQVSENVEGRMPPPVAEVATRERRTRQGLLLSNVLEEFCSWCESVPSRLVIREAYERSLRGQKPAEIAEAMGLPAVQVHSLLHQAREWVYERVKKHDVNRSVFLTLHRRKKEDRPPEAPNVVRKQVCSPGRGLKDQFAGGKSLSEPPMAGENRADLPMPAFSTLADVVHWVIEELGAMCPSPGRLQDFAERPNAPEFRDVRFHVAVAQCKLCQAAVGWK